MEAGSGARGEMGGEVTEGEMAERGGGDKGMDSGGTLGRGDGLSSIRLKSWSATSSEGAFAWG